jgi:4a-hydroxytetrahydrobiopterin dehydratase
MAGTAPALLKAEDVSDRVRRMPEWRVEGSELVQAYRFKNFVEAVDFVNAITKVAEEAGHHPDLMVKWGEVTVHLTSHSAGGLTENDFRMAARIDAL